MRRICQNDFMPTLYYSLITTLFLIVLLIQLVEESNDSFQNPLSVSLKKYKIGKFSP